MFNVTIKGLNQERRWIELSHIFQNFRTKSY